MKEQEAVELKKSSLKSELEPIKLGLNEDEMYVFYFRRPFAAENTDAFLKFTNTIDLVGRDKGEKQFAILKENLIQFASRVPEYHVRKGLELVKEPIAADIAAAFSQYFDEYTPETEQIVTDAWLEFQKKLPSKVYS